MEPIKDNERPTEKSVRPLNPVQIDAQSLTLKLEKATKEIQNYTVYCNNVAHSASRTIGGWTGVSIPLPKLIKGICSSTNDDIVCDEFNNFLRPADRPILPYIEESLC